MAADAMKYTNEVDFSLGDIILPSGSEAVPALVSPAKRSDYGLMTINGLQHTLFAETSLSQAEFNAISQVDATPIENLADPTSEVLPVQNCQWKERIDLHTKNNSKNWYYRSLTG